MRTETYIVLSLIFLAFGCSEGIKNKNNNPPASSYTISVGKGPDAMFLTPDQKKLYIANVEDTFISIINTDKDKVTKTISGIRYPWGFAQLGNTNEVAVTAYDKQLAIINFSTDQVIREKTYSSNLGGITVDSTGQYLYIIAIDIKKVLKIDATTLDSLDSYATGNGPDGIGISKGNGKLYVTNTEDGTISIIDLVSKTVSLINTGGKPELVHPNKDHSLLYISNFNDNKIHVLDTETDSIIHEISGLDGPEEAVPDHQNKKLYVVNFNSAKVFEYKIMGYDKLDKTFSTGSKPIGVIPLNNKLYITNYGDNSVSVITKSNDY